MSCWFHNRQAILAEGVITKIVGIQVLSQWTQSQSDLGLNFGSCPWNHVVIKQSIIYEEFII